MVPGRVRSIQRAIEQKRGVQDRPHHVIEMADKDPPLFEMGIFQDGYGVVVVEVTAEGSEVDRKCGATEDD